MIWHGVEKEVLYGMQRAEDAIKACENAQISGQVIDDKIEEFSTEFLKGHADVNLESMKKLKNSQMEYIAQQLNKFAKEYKEND